MDQIKVKKVSGLVCDGKPIKPLADLNDLSKNMFMGALKMALEECGGSQCELARRLGLELRRTNYWFAKSVMPNYEEAKVLYPRLLKVVGKGVEKSSERARIAAGLK